MSHYMVTHKCLIHIIIPLCVLYTHDCTVCRTLRATTPLRRRRLLRLPFPPTSSLRASTRPEGGSTHSLSCQQLSLTNLPFRILSPTDLCWLGEREGIDREMDLDGRGGGGGDVAGKVREKVFKERRIWMES